MSITKEQWFQQPGLQQELRELLKNPTLQAALAIVKDQIFRPMQIPNEVDLMQYYAIMGARKDGYQEAIINLETLSKSPPPPPPKTDPWVSKESAEANQKQQ